MTHLNPEAAPTLEEKIDRAIKEVWKTKIWEDYENEYIPHEDTLKSVLYHHLRERLEDYFDEGVRVFTGFRVGPLSGTGMRPDLAIVQLAPEPSDSHIRDRIKRVLAVIELKYNQAPSSYLRGDIEKVKKYVKLKELADCQFYVGFVYEELLYEPPSGTWLCVRDKKVLKDRVTELSGCLYKGREQMVFTVISHNSFNIDLGDEAFFRAPSF